MYIIRLVSKKVGLLALSRWVANTARISKGGMEAGIQREKKFFT
jgi:hypothetical protein